MKHSNTFKTQTSLFLVMLLLLIAVAPIRAQRSSNQPVPVKRSDFFVPLSDGVLLDCTKFTPEGMMPPKGWPVLLYCHGYADSKLTELAVAEAQAQYGYCTFAYSMRGQGISGGLSNLISTVEASDLMQLVDYIKKDPDANPNKIGIYGGSQGGIIPFMAACSGMDVRCILSDFGSPEFASSWIENGCVKMTLFFTVDYDSLTVRYNQNVKNIRKWILAKNLFAWDSLSINMPKDRDYPAKVRQCRTPVLLSNAWQDKFFNAEGVIQASAQLTVPFRLYCGAMDGHGADSTYRENLFISSFDNTWMEYWLNDRKNGIVDSTKYHYASSHVPMIAKRWSFTHFRSTVWPPEGLAPMTLYFNPGGKLLPAKNISPVGADTLLNDVRDTALTMQSAIDNRFTGLLFRARFNKTSLTYDSDPLDTELQLIGTPKIHLSYSATANVCQYNFQLWEVKPNDDAGFVTRINFTDRHYKTGAIRDTVVAGQAYSHIFRKGNRIRIVVTNLDTNPDDQFLLTNPHVLPILQRSENVLFMNSSRATYLELPVREAIISDAERIPAAAAELSLSQNYPNPFSQETVLPVNVNASGNVTIKIYDMLGRERAVLADGWMEAGEHRIPVSTQNERLRNLPAGTYIIRAVTGTTVASRSIQLLR